MHIALIIMCILECWYDVMCNIWQFSLWRVFEAAAMFSFKKFGSQRWLRMVLGFGAGIVHHAQRSRTAALSMFAEGMKNTEIAPAWTPARGWTRPTGWTARSTTPRPSASTAGSPLR